MQLNNLESPLLIITLDPIECSFEEHWLIIALQLYSALPIFRQSIRKNENVTTLLQEDVFNTY